jgi:hypothetical protein
MNVQQRAGRRLHVNQRGKCLKSKAKQKYLLGFSLISFKLTKGSNKAEQTFEM